MLHPVTSACLHLHCPECNARKERIARATSNLSGWALHHWPECKGGAACRCADSCPIIFQCEQKPPQGC